jgi:hypothetical protein
MAKTTRTTTASGGGAAVAKPNSPSASSPAKMATVVHPPSRSGIAPPAVRITMIVAANRGTIADSRPVAFSRATAAPNERTET